MQDCPPPPLLRSEPDTAGSRQGPAQRSGGGTYLCDHTAYARAFKAYSSSKRLRSAATWLRPGPPRAARQSEDEEGDREPLLLLEAGDISWV